MAGPTPGLAVPSLLRDLPGWLCWRYERIEGSGKAIKVPYYANAGRRYGRQGDARDRASLVPPPVFATVLSAPPFFFFSVPCACSGYRGSGRGTRAEVGRG